MLKCFVTMVCHNIAHDILMSHQFRQLQIWVLQLHIHKQLMIGGEFGEMLAYWDITSSQVACYCSWHCFMLIIFLCFLQDLCEGHCGGGQRGRKLQESLQAAIQVPLHYAGCGLRVGEG